MKDVFTVEELENLFDLALFGINGNPVIAVDSERITLQIGHEDEERTTIIAREEARDICILRFDVDEKEFEGHLSLMSLKDSK